MRLAYALLLSLCFALSACYEGSGRTRSDSGGGNGQGEGKGSGGGGGKTYGLAILDVIRPSLALLADPNCSGVASSFTDLRAQEMKARVQAVSAQLDGQSDLLRITTDEIQRCGDFSRVETRASTPLPDPQVSDAVKAKLAIHVRLVIWYGNGSDGDGFPSSLVLGTEWADMANLSSLGFSRRLSVNYFALLNDGSGYFPAWQNESDGNVNFVAQVLDNPIHDPSEENLKRILTSVTSSQANFTDWLSQKVRGL